MKTLKRLNRTAFAAACAVLIVAAAPLYAYDQSSTFRLLQANAGVNVSIAGTQDPLVGNATAFGLVQSPLLGTCVENGQFEARFPTNPANPVIINGTLSLTSINGTNSLAFKVSGSALPDPVNPAFYNAKYSLTITNGTGAFASAKGTAVVREVVLFTSQTNAMATWNLKGFVSTPCTPH